MTINPREFVANFKNNFNISVQRQYKLLNEIINHDYFQLAYFPETWEGLLIKHEQISNSNPVVLIVLWCSAKTRKINLMVHYVLCLLRSEAEI